MKLTFDVLVPRLPASRDDRGFVIVWCKYCRKYHSHGYATVHGDHKIAHCHVMSSPYRTTGYYIVLEGERLK